MSSPPARPHVLAPREFSFDRGIAYRTLLDLGIHVLNDFLKDNVDFRPSLIVTAGRAREVFAADLAEVDFRERYALFEGIAT
jgi:hypothetical protein